MGENTASSLAQLLEELSWVKMPYFSDAVSSSFRRASQ